ncbi:hypothetical protein XCR_3589 [Xanthomonas campestris pv. raphani 756C]|nr:hypothetical protein XCR_3589 [Xanthomonas campestris pv. raphani 756C]
MVPGRCSPHRTGRIVQRQRAPQRHTPAAASRPKRLIPKETE